MKTIVVAGGAGFLGFHLCSRLLADGYRVISLDNYSTGSHLNTLQLENLSRQNGWSFQSFRFSSEDHWSKWSSQIPSEQLKTIRRVFYFASPASPKDYLKNPLATMMANSSGLKNALEFCLSMRARLIFSSTSEVYGTPLHRPQQEYSMGPSQCYSERACYFESKRFGEALIYSFNKMHQTNHGLVRLFNTYGPRMRFDDGRVVNEFVKNLIHQKPLQVFGSGTQTRSFCFISDLIEGILRYSDSDLTLPINLGNNEEISILDLAYKISALFPDTPLEIQHLPLPEGEPLVRCPDLTLAKKYLSWHPMINLDTGLDYVKKWMLNTSEDQPLSFSSKKASLDIAKKTINPGHSFIDGQ